MTSAAPLLVELHTEELPPKALARLGDAFAKGIADGLDRRGLAADAQLTVFASPRRLAVRVHSVLEQAPDRDVELKGPSIKVGLDEHGQPTMALRKWAERQQLAIESLQQRDVGKQTVFIAQTTLIGEHLGDVLQEIIEQAIVALPVPKLMQYQLADGRTSVSFVRPARRLTVLHGEQVLPTHILGLDSGRESFGHRFLSSGPIQIPDANAYESTLESARVIVGFEARRDRIERALHSQAAALGMALGDADEFRALLDEVTALVEWPAVYVGRFETEFLSVPQECLILTMRTNQKYFPLFDTAGKLAPSFLIVSNMEIDDPSQIIDGNERVIRPRLADARFFFEQDRKQRLADRLPLLDAVIYHARLGTMAQRVQRVRQIAAAIARRTGADVALAERAAELAKCDLPTGMVGEFPELQGVMGAYYARHDGEAEALVAAMQEQYQPRFAGDALPAGETGTVLALADKLETLAGLFSIGQLPSGDKDPFALRRHALGVLRMLVEKQLDLPLDELIGIAFDAFAPAPDKANAELQSFFFDRLLGYLRDQGFANADIASVLALRPMQLRLVPGQLAAVREFAKLPQAQALAAANKRIGNILRKVDAAASDSYEPALLSDDAERALAAAIAKLAPEVDAAMARQDFAGAMAAMAGTRDAVDRFFDEVMVMAPDTRVRSNRLALLTRLHHLMNRVADISKLAAT